MGRKTGEPITPPEGWDVTQVDEVDLNDIAASFRDIAAKLSKASEQASQFPGRPDYIDPKTGEPFASSDEGVRLWSQKFEIALEELLIALRETRGGWAYWERVAAEFALLRAGMTQRRVADALGVSTNTVNRWAQHPVGFNWPDDASVGN